MGGGIGGFWALVRVEYRCFYFCEEWFFCECVRFCAGSVEDA